MKLNMEIGKKKHGRVSLTYRYDGADDKRMVMSQNRIVRAFKAHMQLRRGIVLHILQSLTGESQPPGTHKTKSNN
jgi:hypothetical protein